MHSPQALGNKEWNGQLALLLCSAVLDGVPRQHAAHTVHSQTALLHGCQPWYPAQQQHHRCSARAGCVLQPASLTQPALCREVQRILMELLNQMDGFDQTVNVKVRPLARDIGWPPCPYGKRLRGLFFVPFITVAGTQWVPTRKADQAHAWLGAQTM